MEGTSKYTLFPADDVDLATREFDPDLYSFESVNFNIMQLYTYIIYLNCKCLRRLRKSLSPTRT